jgi:hypothetical protein
VSSINQECGSSREAHVHLRHGRTLEAIGAAAALQGAVARYTDAVALFRTCSGSRKNCCRHDLAVALMNRGNARQKISTIETITLAIADYDEAIAILQLLPAPHPIGRQNTLGAAWLNRGHAHLQKPDAPALAAAVESFENAIAILRTLTVTNDASYLINLAGAEINLATALVITSKTPALDRALALSRQALSRVATTELTSLASAELGLKARRVACEVIAHLLVVHADDPTVVSDLIGEATNAADSGLSLALDWRHRGATQFDELGVRLFRFGAQFYQIHQPQFLAEFVLEHLTAWLAGGRPNLASEPFEIARAAISSARRELATRPLVGVDETMTLKLLRLSSDLADAESAVQSLSQSRAA